ncbi:MULTISPECIES: ATP-dependent Clp protease adaptor ClpS [Spirosoma]|uniref:ATP-dependent Clp protease adaptor ClpS n=1 Tax=Spirosoma liriopis TaxID=2937440 RepID=A0ABT0HP98_9BACT|nr:MULTISPECIES: ATP-dependent Clp protease adaptor ClpS [Spirosoma]MCK8493998.1 ATP-dependent Clp protease adaptor ClpS [Spirosoma liriopis]UHG89017.1 ATP-dependent Clp protease adaptor ClpS [Spirosoma oryzicola]
MQPFEETEVDVLEEVVETDVHSLVVFNDDVNTFDHVIDTLIDVCHHTPEQAEQCTLLIHYKGKCAVKNGSWEELVPMRNEICRRGISAEVVN